MAVAFIGMGLIGMGILILSTAGSQWNGDADQGAVLVSFILCMSGGIATLAAAGALGWSGERVHGRAGEWMSATAVVLVCLLFVCALVASTLADPLVGPSGD
jgi:hypothetical protein